ncbi:hypothetical protein [Nitrosomonas sp. Nm132]|uniref:hypothetical protein n=1 Tax=Nitrosomonas sp. Nm132 TaxID=1881053 RepID=UPI000888A990|nr:hypothetical protein [Nitrosomonas sp. Nm132]SDH14285.1 hypothetical protein SAMN05428952_100648 [Nitrosomonas sp. Nm132]
MGDQKNHQSSYIIVPAILNLIAEISEMIGCYTALAEQSLTSALRRENRIRTTINRASSDSIALIKPLSSVFLQPSYNEICRSIVR